MKHIDPAAGKARFYVVMVAETLFSEWEVTREWGRIGQGGTVRWTIYPSKQEAVDAAEEVVIRKTRRGYVQR